MLLCLDVDFSVFANSQIGPQWSCYVTCHVLQCGTYIIVFMINFNVVMFGNGRKSQTSGTILDDSEQRRKLKSALGLGRLCLVFEISSFVKD